MLAMRRQPMVWVALAALAVVLVGRAAFAAANTVPESSAGQGSNVVSGFTISNIDYNLNGTNPLNIDTVVFDAQAADVTQVGSLTVRTMFDVSAADWYACAAVSGGAGLYTITCDVDGTPGPQLTALNVDTLNTVIVEQ